ERLSLPKLGARFVVGLVSCERAGEISFLAFRSQTRIQRGNAPFSRRLRHRDDEILGRADIVTDKKHIQIGAIPDVAAAKFSERDNRYVTLVSADAVDENQARFRKSRLFGEECRKLCKAEHVSQ